MKITIDGSFRTLSLLIWNAKSEQSEGINNWYEVEASDPKFWMQYGFFPPCQRVSGADGTRTIANKLR